MKDQFLFFWNKQSKTTKTILILVALGMLGNLIPDRTPAPRTASASAPRTERAKMADHPMGFELWKDGNCVVLKGVTTNQLNALGGLSAYKSEIKQSTGYTCVLVE